MSFPEKVSFMISLYCRFHISITGEGYLSRKKSVAKNSATMTTKMKAEKKAGLFFALCCIALAFFFAIAAILSGFGTRLGWWHFRTGLLLLRWAAFSETAVFLTSFIGFLYVAFRKSGRNLILLLVALVISLSAFSVPFSLYLIARSVPAIHDITTDTENPPRFDAVLAIRKGALNPAEYGGQEIAEQQQKAYPDIGPLFLELPPEKAFEHALAAARSMGWEIVSSNSGKGIIEATATTFWFGFKDDIVVRITPQGSSSLIDIRSLSRVGKSDVGANAARIRKFLKALRQAA
jgi:uncharacterized protein (DUF1499 family)